MARPVSPCLKSHFEHRVRCGVQLDRGTGQMLGLDSVSRIGQVLNHPLIKDKTQGCSDAI